MDDMSMTDYYVLTPHSRKP